VPWAEHHVRISQVVLEAGARELQFANLSSGFVKVISEIFYLLLSISNCLLQFAYRFEYGAMPLSDNLNP
jgi:hypothetical protein